MHFQDRQLASMLKKYVARFGTLLCLVSLASCGWLPQKQQSGEATPSDARKPANLVSIAPFPLISWVTVADKSPAPPAWKHYQLPGKRATSYAFQRLDGRQAVMAKADSSASMMRQSVRISPGNLGKLKFSWKVPQLIDGADLSLRDAHDSPVRVTLVFEGDRSTFSAKNAMLSELARTLTGEELPYATLMYVWCNACAPDQVFTSPRTDRIREIALQSGAAQLNQWLDYERDINLDFQKAFGEAPGALLDVGIMTDTDNTRQTAVVWYGPISMLPQ